MVILHREKCTQIINPTPKYPSIPYPDVPKGVTVLLLLEFRYKPQETPKNYKIMY